MPAQEAGPSQNRIAREGQGHTQTVAPLFPCDQRPEVGKHRYIGTQGMNGTDSTLVTRHSSPVAGPGDGGGHGRGKPNTHQECGAVARLDSSRDIKDGRAAPAAKRQIGQRRMDRMAKDAGMERTSPSAIENRFVQEFLGIS